MNIIVALLADQADYLLNLLAVQDTDLAKLIYDQIEQSQLDAIENEWAQPCRAAPLASLRDKAW